MRPCSCQRVMIYQGGNRRMVGLSEAMETVELQLGDEVLLNQDLTLVLARSPRGGRQVGETAAFDATPTTAAWSSAGGTSKC